MVLADRVLLFVPEENSVSGVGWEQLLVFLSTVSERLGACVRLMLLLNAGFVVAVGKNINKILLPSWLGLFVHT